MGRDGTSLEKAVSNSLSEVRYVHFACFAIFFLVGALMRSSSEHFNVDVTASTVGEDKQTRAVLLTVNVPWLIMCYLWVAGAMHLAAAVLFRTYSEQIRQEANGFRWMEYSVSSSLMMVLLALLLGIDDVDALGLIGASMACCNLFGWLAEKHSSSFAHVLGWVPFAAGWGALHRAFYMGDHADYLIFLFHAMQVAFTLFGVVQVMQIMGLFKRYIQLEYAYTILSLVTKVTMAMIVYMTAV